ncbi:MAG: glycosyl transferase family 2 [Candidatus Melainabacteria bacterium]|nr:MAG: glycosyl transferase family 2 [Candidatus Melainabacteria bacterium]
MDITIIMPVYCEGENIKIALDRIKSELKFPYIVKIIYDFDEDNTLDALKGYDLGENIKLVKNGYGKGVLNAIKFGLETTDTKYAVVTMADLCDPPYVINDMYEMAEKNNSDIVCASRYMKGGKQIGGPFIKGLMSKVAGLTLHYFAKVPVHDATNSFKLYKKDFLRKQNIESSGGFELGIELVVKAHLSKARINEVPTSWYDRKKGESRFKLIKWLPRYLKWYIRAFTN